MLRNAEVAELADALRSGRSEHYAREGSNPSFGTKAPLGLFASGGAARLLQRAALSKMALT